MANQWKLRVAVASAMFLASMRVDAGPSLALAVQDAAVAVTCPITVGGSFVAKTSTVSGDLRLASTEGGEVVGDITVDLTGLDTGIGLRNTHLRDNYLEVGKGDGFAAARLASLVIKPSGVLGSGDVTFTAKLTIHGVTKDLEGKADVRAVGDGYRVKATFSVHLPDHDIAKPRHLGIGVKDDVKVEIELTLAPAASAASGDPS